SEWWYYTGHLHTADGRRFGYELTFFRYGLRPGEMRLAADESRWHGSQIYPAHFAITDERAGAFVHYERLAREALGMGYASAQTLAVGSNGWSLRGEGGTMRLHAAVGGDGLDLVLRPQKRPAIHGHGGVSRKAACRSCASHYYSLTRLQTSGALVRGGVRYAAGGVSWMDHEFGSDELQADQAGWDWFSLQLSDGRDVMLYRLRRIDGTQTPESSGSVVERDGSVRYLPRAAFAIDAAGTWRSPHTGARYPSGWRVRIAGEGIDLTVTPALRDQELADAQLGVAYWEGACDVAGTDRGRSVRGLAYVELTGYAEPVAR
ncbi:MAG: carotenoid 1,2-hydratase, partial [Candidatus Eremiobacteraeota bacterium]|nr:carotenoid 1,2-hydratase [Candidatus Eremiobacteraeota bacterium]